MTICWSHRFTLPVFLARRIAGNRLQAPLGAGRFAAPHLLEAWFCCAEPLAVRLGVPAAALI